MKTLVRAPPTAAVGMVVLSLLLLGCPADRPGTLPESGPEFPWRGWGGPGGDFKVAAGTLADGWPPAGPPVIWRHALGPGYSAVVHDRGVLFTLYRDGGEDVVVALRADDGATIWEYRYPAVIRRENLRDYGTAPRATPLILDDRVVTLGFGGTLNALDFATGRLLWSMNLVSDLDGQIIDYGNAASPILHAGSVIVLAGGEHALSALDPRDGTVRWRSGSGTVSFATPIVIDVDGQEQLVYMSEEEIIGLDARNGERLWSHRSYNRNRDNISTPIWGDDQLLWFSTQPDGGARVVRLERHDADTRVHELWHNRKAAIHFWSALRLGDHVYASIGGQGSVFACLNVHTGEIVWRRRGFEKVNFVHVGDRTVLLDAKGELALVRLSPEGLSVLSQATITDLTTWTRPTLVDTTLYVRDRATLLALDLSAPDE